MQLGWALQTGGMPVLVDCACWTMGAPVLLNWAFAVEGSASEVARLIPVGKTGLVGPWVLLWHCFFVSFMLVMGSGVSIACGASR